MSEYLEVQAADGRFRVYCDMPATTPAPAVVVLQEIFGINEDMKQTCAWLAQAGYIALCPDLFWRDAPGLALSSWSEQEWKRGLELYRAYDRDRGVDDVARVLQAGRTLAQGNGKVGVMGFCLGGLMTFLTAARRGADAAVAYYGGETDKYAGEAPAVATPLLMHLAEADEFITPPARQAIMAAVQGNPQIRVHTYPGCNHAFARHTGAHYDAAAAALANGRTLEWFAARLR